jgi:TetR/AcrR family transcriptional regulator
VRSNLRRGEQKAGSVATRLPAEERKAAVLDCACGIFSTGSYRGTTTAEIARQAGVTEPILYRHFESKRELYLAVLDESWRRLRALWDEVVAAEENPKLWIAAIGRAYFEASDPRLHSANLWIQSLTEASDDPEIRKYLRKHMREVHGYVADLIRRSQEAGGVIEDRDPRAEAWIFIAVGLLGTVGRRIGGLLEDDFPAIFAARRKWMTGEDTPPLNIKVPGA